MGTMFRAFVSIVNVALFAMIYTSSVTANQQALDWLQTQQAADGSYSVSDSIATPFQATSETVLAQHATSAPTAPTALAFIDADTYVGIEYLVRKIQVNAAQGTDVSALAIQLLSHQNADGGFGELPGYDSTPLDTAMALIALSEAGYSNENQISTALAYLLNEQLVDGGFPLRFPNDSAVYVTAVSSIALQKYMFYFDLVGAITQANQFILSQQTGAGDWSSHWETAIALLAVAPLNPDPSPYLAAIDSLEQGQLVNGSWDDDAYVTALAIRAQHLVAQTALPVPANLSALVGKVLDQNSNVPLSGATVSLQENPSFSVSTASDGLFRLNDFPPGAYTVLVQKTGYIQASIPVSTLAGQLQGLGEVHLSPLTTGSVMSGQVTDAETGFVIPGAQIVVSGSTSGNVSTDLSGTYSILLNPGSVTVTVTATDYDPVVGTVNVVSGGSINFSPGLYHTNQTPVAQTVSVRGLVIDSDTGSVLPGTDVAINGSSTLATTSTPFQIDGISAGTITIDLTLNGYNSIHYETFAPAGSLLDLGVINMQALPSSSTSTITGQVVDAADGTPIPNAEVLIQGVPTPVVTDASGAYSFTGLTGTSFVLSSSAVGYLSKSVNVSLSAPGTFNHTIELDRAASSEFDIVNVHTYQQQYAALTEVEVDAVLLNSGLANRDILLFIKVANADGQVIGQYPARYLSVGFDAYQDILTIPPGDPVEAEAEWSSDRHDPGFYSLTIQAFDSTSNTLLAERATQIEILPTRRISGSARFDPPITQLAAGRAVNIDANIANHGNEPIDASVVTARVRLANQGYQVPDSPVQISVKAQNQGIDQPYGFDIDSSGIVYVVNYHGNSVSTVSSDGTVSLFADNVPAPVDVDIDTGGNVYVLLNHNVYIKYLTDGTSEQVNTGLSNQGAIEVMADGRVLISSLGRLYERLDTGQINLIVENGISQAHGIAMDSLGRIFIANTNGDNILVYANGEVSIFVDGIDRPYGIDIDDQDRLLVTTYMQNQLLRIAQDGQITVVTDGLAGPYDVKVSPQGNYVVSNNNSDEIVSVTPAGQIQVIVGPSLYGSRAADYDASGNLFVGNGNGANVIQMDANLATSQTFQGYPGITDIQVSPAGGFDILYTGGLSHVDASGTETNISSTRYSVFDSLADGSGYYAVDYDQVEFINSAGQASVYTQNQIVNPRYVVRKSTGGFYLMNAASLVWFDSNGNYRLVANDIGVNLNGMVEDASGNLYFNDANSRTLFLLDASENVTEVAQTSFYPAAMTITTAGNVLVAERNGFDVYEYSNGSFSVFATFPYRLTGDIHMDAGGNLWATHATSARVSKLNLDGSITSFTMTAPRGIYEEGGVVYISSNNTIQAIDVNDQVTAHLNDGFNGAYGFARDAGGREVIVLSAAQIISYDASHARDTVYYSLGYPRDIALMDDGSLIVVNTQGRTMRVTDPARFPEFLLANNHWFVEKESATSILLANTSSFGRLNLSSGQYTAIGSGFNGLWSMAVNPAGGYAVLENTRSSLRLYDSQDTLVDRIQGLVSPKGLVFDQNGDLLVANTGLNNIARVRADGNVEPYSNLISTFEYLALKSNGNLVVTNPSSIMEIDSDGTLVYQEFMQPTTIKGLLVNSADEIVFSATSELSQFSNGQYSKLASGLSNISDIEIDTQGEIFVADVNNDTVVHVAQDASLELAMKNVPNVESIAFEQGTGNMFVAYGGSFVAYLDSNGDRTELKVDGVIDQRLTGIGFETDGVMLATVAEIDLLARVENIYPESTPQINEVVYQASRSIPALPEDDTTLAVDFGSWVPTHSGDYVVEVVIGDGQTEGALANTLHVGPMASGNLMLTDDLVLPGDRPVSGNLMINGADSTRITQVDPNGIAFSAQSGATSSRALAADSQGNVFVARGSTIVKVQPDGTVTDFVTNLAIGTGMAVDSSDVLYAVGSYSPNVYRIDPDGTVTTITQTLFNAVAVATDYDDNLYVLDSSTLSRVNADGSLTAIRTIQNGRGLTIDAYGNFYIVKGPVIQPESQIIKISPDGRNAEVLLDNASFEYEGVNVVADCSNNLLFAPWSLPPLRPQTTLEENEVFQLVGDTRQVQRVLYGAPGSPLTDMDILFYDRHGQRLVIWTDLNAGSIFSFPVICGGIDVEAHVVTRADVDLSSTDPAPTNIIDNPDGTREFMWLLSDVDNRGRNIALNMQFNGLLEEETRPAFAQAYLQFNNSFDAANPVQVPLDIPSLTARTAVSVQPSLGASQYGPQADVTMDVSVVNDAGTLFNGTLQLAIEDMSGATVASLPDIAVSNLAGMSNVLFNAQWNTGQTYAGNYILRATLLNDGGVSVATGQDQLEVVNSAPTGSSIITSQVYTDKASYLSWDQVNIEARVRNEASNVIQLPSLATVTVVSPTGTTLYSEQFSVRELYAGSYQDLLTRMNLVEAADGSYTINLVVTDSAGAAQLSSSTTQFSVGGTVTQALTGTTSATPRQLDAGASVVCDSQVSNISSGNYSGVVVAQRLADMASGTILSEETTTVSILAGSNESFVRTIDTSGLPQGEYACLLAANVDGTDTQLSAAGFQVNQTTVQLATSVQTQGTGRMLVLLDDVLANNDQEPNGPDLSPLLSYQRSYLESQLDAAGWSYKIVTTKADFLSEMHLGGYSSYALFNEKITFEKEPLLEIRERVYSGDGLLQAGGKWAHIYHLYGALGTQSTFEWIHHNGVIDFAASPLSIAGTQALPHYEEMSCFALDGAQVAATSNDDPAQPVLCNETNRAAVIHYDYGEGRSVMTAFDLLLQAVDTQPTELLDDLMVNSLNYIQPASISMTPNKMVPVTVAVNNTGTASSVRVLTTIPAGISVLDTDGGELLAGNQVRHEFSLAGGESQSVTVWIQLPDSTAPITVSVETQAGDGITWSSVDNQSIVITPADLPGLAEARALLEADTSGHWMVDEALNFMTMAETSIASGLYMQAVKELSHAADYVTALGWTNSHDIRLMLDKAIRDTARLAP